MQAFVVEVEHRSVAHPRSFSGVSVNQKRAADAASERSPGERRDAQPMRAEQASKNDAKRIDQRRNCLIRELLSHQSDGSEYTAGEKEQLAGQQDARHVDGEGIL